MNCNLSNRCVTLVAVFAFIFSSCQRVDSLSDSAKVKSVAIEAVSPERVIFDTPVIEGTDIKLPLVYGKYIFPIRVSLKVTAESDCEQILGFDDGKSTFTFDNINHVRELYTVAPSGATTRWNIRIVDAQSNESAEILRAAVSAPDGADVVVSPYAFIDRIESRVVFRTLGKADYPLTFMPSFTIAEGASWIDADGNRTEAPEEIVFADADTVMEYRIEAASGNTKTWSFASAAVLPTDNGSAADFTDEQVRRIMPDTANIAFSSQTVRMIGRTAEFNVTSPRIGGRITLEITPFVGDAVAFPVRAAITLPVSEEVTLIGAPDENLYTFGSYNDTYQVWVVDNRTGVAKAWTVAIAPRITADVLSCGITGYTSSLGDKLSVATDEVEIDPKMGRIIVPVSRTDGAAIGASERLSLKLNLDFVLSEGATTTSKQVSFTYVTNTGSVTVKSANGIVSRSWYVYLRDENGTGAGDNRIHSFQIVSYRSKNGLMQLGSNSATVDNDKRTVTLKIKSNPLDFPLMITRKTVRLYSGSAVITDPGIASFDTPIVFSSLHDVKRFQVKGADDTLYDWTLQLESQATGHMAEIIDMRLTGVSSGVNPTGIMIEREQRRIRIEVEGILPFYAKVDITTTENASVSGLDNGMLVFDTYNTEIPLKVVSQDGLVEHIWTVYIDKPTNVQIANSEFELWGEFNNVNSGTMTIDPTPGVGYGWSTANLKVLGIGVIGTSPIERADGTLGAKMVTSEQNTIIKGYVLAAGTLFTGRFNMDLNSMTQPRKMTKFGIPFTARPQSVSMEVRYTPGQQMKQAVADASGKYSIHDIEGVDKAHIWVELFRWNGKGDVEYDGYPENNPDVQVIGRAELVIDGADNPYKDWRYATLPVIYDPAMAGAKPTHIAVVMSSSKDGDSFIGALGSELAVDHFKINY